MIWAVSIVSAVSPLSPLDITLTGADKRPDDNSMAMATHMKLTRIRTSSEYLSGVGIFQ